MKWLTDLFRTDPDKMTPFGRQVLADMNIHPEDWGLGLDVAHHSEFGTFERTVFTGFQRAKPTLSTRDSIAAESVRKDFRQFNRHDRRAFGQRHATMLASEIPPKAAPENLTALGTMGAVAQTLGVQRPNLTAATIRAATREAEMEIAKMQAQLQAQNVQNLQDMQAMMAANPPMLVTSEQIAAEFGIAPNNLNKLSTL